MAQTGTSMLVLHPPGPDSLWDGTGTPGHYQAVGRALLPGSLCDTQSHGALQQGVCLQLSDDRSSSLSSSAYLPSTPDPSSPCARDGTQATRTSAGASTHLDAGHLHVCTSDSDELAAAQFADAVAWQQAREVRSRMLRDRLVSSDEDRAMPAFDLPELALARTVGRWPHRRWYLTRKRSTTAGMSRSF